MTKLNVSSVITELAKIAPFALIICALLSFLAVGIFSTDYYQHLFEKRFGGSAFAMAVMVASIQEAVRFGLLITSLHDFRSDNLARGWIGLLASIWLVWHDISISYQLANLWDPTKPKQYSSILIFLIVIGLVLELRLVLSITGKKMVEKKYQRNNQNGSSKTANTADVLSLDV